LLFEENALAITHGEAYMKFWQKKEIGCPDLKFSELLKKKLIRLQFFNALQV